MKYEPNEHIPLCNRPPSNRVLVYMIKEKPRPLISFGGCLMLHRPGDWVEMSFEEWQAEHDRREAIDRLMTEEERKVFNKYCWLRDD